MTAMILLIISSLALLDAIVIVWFLIGLRGLFLVRLLVPPLDEGETRIGLFADPQIEGDGRISREGWYGTINNQLNDWMMTHVSRSVYFFGHVSLVLTLGDLFSSQLLSDDEFSRRAARAERIFDFGHEISVVHLAGNHDLGYGAELNRRSVERWERRLGPMNTQRHFADHQLITLNAMALDNDNASCSWAQEVWAHVGKCARSPASAGNLLFLHIPLHKEAGACPGDTPFIAKTGKHGRRGERVTQQTLLSERSSARLLDSLQPTLIFSGHDHEGCIYTHNASDGAPPVTEHTLRALQGDYGSMATIFSIKQTHKGYQYHLWTVSLASKTIHLVIWALTSILIIPIELILYKQKRAKNVKRFKSI